MRHSERKCYIFYLFSTSGAHLFSVQLPCLHKNIVKSTHQNLSTIGETKMWWSYYSTLKSRTPYSTINDDASVILLRKIPIKSDLSILESKFLEWNVELVSKELNHLAAILHVYAGVWILWSKKRKKNVIIFQKENGNTFTLLIIFIVKSLQN